MKIIFVLFLFAFIQSADIYDPSNIYNAIMVKLKAKMPEKTKWDNSDYYKWEVKVNMGGFTLPSYGGKGCAGFAMMASDAAFGSISAFKFEDKSKIRVGDIIYNGSHFVILVKKLSATRYVIAEGNYNYYIHYGREIDINTNGFTYGFTRYTS